MVVASEAEALLAEQSFIKQYRPRFNIRLRDDKSYPFIAISLDEDYPRVYFTRERHRARPRLLRAVLERQAGALDARGAGQGLHVPLLHRARAGAAQRQPVPGLLHQALRGALRRLRHAARSTGAAIDGVIDFLSGPLLGDRARPRGADARGGGERGVRAGDARAQPPAGRALAARAPPRDGRLDGHVRRGRGRARRPRRQRPGLPGARRRALRPPVLLPLQRDRARARRGGRGVHAPVLRRAASSIPALLVVQREAVERPALAEALASRRGGPRRAARGRARREAAHPRARRAQRAARARPGQAALRAPPPGPRRGARGAADGARPRRPAGAHRVLRHLQPRRHPHGRLDGRVRGGRAEEIGLPALQDPHDRGRARRLRLDGGGARTPLRAVGAPDGHLAARPRLRPELRRRCRTSS